MRQLVKQAWVTLTIVLFVLAPFSLPFSDSQLGGQDSQSAGAVLVAQALDCVPGACTNGQLNTTPLGANNQPIPTFSGNTTPLGANGQPIPAFTAPAGACTSPNVLVQPSGACILSTAATRNTDGTYTAKQPIAACAANQTYVNTGGVAGGTCYDNSSLTSDITGRLVPKGIKPTCGANQTYVEIGGVLVGACMPNTAVTKDVSGKPVPIVSFNTTPLDAYGKPVADAAAVNKCIGPECLPLPQEALNPKSDALVLYALPSTVHAGDSTVVSYGFGQPVTSCVSSSSPHDSLWEQRIPETVTRGINFVLAPINAPDRSQVFSSIDGKSPFTNLDLQMLFGASSTTGVSNGKTQTSAVGIPFDIKSNPKPSFWDTIFSKVHAQISSVNQVVNRGLLSNVIVGVTGKATNSSSGLIDPSSPSHTVNQMKIYTPQGQLMATVWRFQDGKLNITEIATKDSKTPVYFYDGKEDVKNPRYDGDKGTSATKYTEGPSYYIGTRNQVKTIYFGTEIVRGNTATKGENSDKVGGGPLPIVGLIKINQSSSFNPTDVLDNAVSTNTSITEYSPGEKSSIISLGTSKRNGISHREDSIEGTGQLYFPEGAKVVTTTYTQQNLADILPRLDSQIAAQNSFGKQLTGFIDGTLQAAIYNPLEEVTKGAISFGASVVKDIPSKDASGKLSVVSEPHPTFTVEPVRPGGIKPGVSGTGHDAASTTSPTSGPSNNASISFDDAKNKTQQTQGDLEHLYTPEEQALMQKLKNLVADGITDDFVPHLTSAEQDLFVRSEFEVDAETGAVAATNLLEGLPDGVRVTPVRVSPLKQTTTYTLKCKDALGRDVSASTMVKTIGTVTRKYKKTGSYLSEVTDITDLNTLGKFIPTATIPAGTDITYQFASNLSGFTKFSSAVKPTNGSINLTTILELQGARAFKVKVVLSGNGTVTPNFKSFKLSYTPKVVPTAPAPVPTVAAAVAKGQSVYGEAAVITKQDFQLTVKTACTSKPKNVLTWSKPPQPSTEEFAKVTYRVFGSNVARQFQDLPDTLTYDDTRPIGDVGYYNVQAMFWKDTDQKELVATASSDSIRYVAPSCNAVPVSGTGTGTFSVINGRIFSPTVNPPTTPPTGQTSGYWIYTDGTDTNGRGVGWFFDAGSIPTVSATTSTTTPSTPAPVLYPTVTDFKVKDGSVTSTAATITWTTDQASSSRVDYGPATGYDKAKYEQSTCADANCTADADRVTAHSIDLKGLTPATQYVFRLRSTSTQPSNTATDKMIFTTTAAPATVAPSTAPKSTTPAPAVKVSPPVTTPPPLVAPTVSVTSAQCKVKVLGNFGSITINPPAPVTSSLTISWTAIADATSYQILRADGTQTPTFFAAIPNTITTYIDTSPVVGQQYTYQIKALTGTQEALSKGVTVTNC